MSQSMKRNVEQAFEKEEVLDQQRNKKSKKRRKSAHGDLHSQQSRTERGIHVDPVTTSSVPDTATPRPLLQTSQAQQIQPNRPKRGNDHASMGGL